MKRENGVLAAALLDISEFQCRQPPPDMVERDAVEGAVEALLGEVRTVIDRAAARLDGIGLSDRQKAAAISEFSKVVTETERQCAALLGSSSHTN